MVEMKVVMMAAVTVDAMVPQMAVWTAVMKAEL